MSQDGYFTTAQAAQVGYYFALLYKHLKSGKVQRVRRGVYRLVHFPASDHEDLVVLWLWSGQHGVLSHETALVLHRLSDALPSRVHMTLPMEWQSRRLKIPEGLALHYGEVDLSERSWFGGLPITSPARCLNDCAGDNVSPELVAQALDEGLERGLFREDEVRIAAEYLRAFGKDDD